MLLSPQHYKTVVRIPTDGKVEIQDDLGQSPEELHDTVNGGVLGKGEDHQAENEDEDGTVPNLPLSNTFRSYSPTLYGARPFRGEVPEDVGESRHHFNLGFVSRLILVLLPHFVLFCFGYGSDDSRSSCYEPEILDHTFFTLV